jgi:hypothetical protein
MQHLLQDLTIGSNKINQMSAYEVGAKVLFILPLSLLFFLDQLTLFQILWLNTGTALLAMAAVFWQLRPSLRHWRRRLRELRSKQRSYGRHYYAGQPGQYAVCPDGDDESGPQQCPFQGFCEP